MHLKRILCYGVIPFAAISFIIGCGGSFEASDLKTAPSIHPPISKDTLQTIQDDDVRDFLVERIQGDTETEVKEKALELGMAIAPATAEEVSKVILGVEAELGVKEVEKGKVKDLIADIGILYIDGDTPRSTQARLKRTVLRSDLSESTQFVQVLTNGNDSRVKVFAACTAQCDAVVVRVDVQLEDGSVVVGGYAFSSQGKPGQMKILGSTVGKYYRSAQEAARALQEGQKAEDEKKSEQESKKEEAAKEAKGQKQAQDQINNGDQDQAAGDEQSKKTDGESKSGKSSTESATKAAAEGSEKGEGLQKADDKKAEDTQSPKSENKSDRSKKTDLPVEARESKTKGSKDVSEAKEIKKEFSGTSTVKAKGNQKENKQEDTKSASSGQKSAESNNNTVDKKEQCIVEVLENGGFIKDGEPVNAKGQKVSCN